MEELAQESRTMVLYEAPHHLVKLLQELKEALGDRKITICRELTKKFETVMPMTLEEAVTYYERNEPRGEYVLVVEGKGIAVKQEEARQGWRELSVEEHMRYYEEQGTERKEAMKLVAKDRGIGKREVYQALLKQKTE